MANVPVRTVPRRERPLSGFAQEERVECADNERARDERRKRALHQPAQFRLLGAKTKCQDAGCNRDRQECSTCHHAKLERKTIGRVGVQAAWETAGTTPRAHSRAPGPRRTRHGRARGQRARRAPALQPRQQSRAPHRSGERAATPVATRPPVQKRHRRRCARARSQEPQRRATPA